MVELSKHSLCPLKPKNGLKSNLFFIGRSIKMKVNKSRQNQDFLLKLQILIPKINSNCFKKIKIILTKCTLKRIWDRANKIIWRKKMKTTMLNLKFRKLSLRPKLKRLNLRNWLSKTRKKKSIKFQIPNSWKTSSIKLKKKRARKYQSSSKEMTEKRKPLKSMDNKQKRSSILRFNKLQKK